MPTIAFVVWCILLFLATFNMREILKKVILIN